jgi:hypothetical protein
MKNIQILGLWFLKRGLLNGNLIIKSTLFFMLLFVATTFAQTTISRQITNNDDDVEQNVSGGAMDLASSDLEMVVDGSNRQIVGMRFTNLNVPQGARVSNSYVQFTSDKDNSGTVNLTIKGERTGNASRFTNGTNNISNRSTTSNSVGWSPLSWVDEDRGERQRTTNLASILNEIFARGDWSSGNSVVLIITGSSNNIREADSHDESATRAAQLFITYSLPVPPTAVITTPNSTITIASGTNQNFVGTATANAPASSITNYSWNLGDGSAIVQGASLTAPNHVFTNTTNANIVRTVSLTVTDNLGDTATATRNITVQSDTDNDGIPDSLDLDDDNDGILDTDETVLCNLLENVSFETPARPANTISAGSFLTDWTTSANIVNGTTAFNNPPAVTGNQAIALQATFLLRANVFGGKWSSKS